MRNRAAASDASMESISGARKPLRSTPRGHSARQNTFGASSRRRVFVTPTDSYVALFPGGQVSFSGLAKLSAERLRSVGMSRSKAKSVHDLSRKVLDGTIPAPARLRKVPDEALIELLCGVHGIGRWTAETYLIFRLGRMDIMPADDLVLRKGFARIIVRSSTLPTPKMVREYAVRWSPYRTVAAKILWSAG